MSSVLEAPESETIPAEIKLQPLPVEVATGASKALTYARTITVTDDRSYELAAEEIKGFKTRWNALEALRVSFTEPLNKHVKRLNDFFRNPLADLKAAEEVAKETMLTYRKEQIAKAEEERRRAEEAAQKARAEAERKAREEREKAEAEERRQREEAARKQREAAEADRLAREAREREAEAKRRGDEEAERKAKQEREAEERRRREAEEAARKAETKADKAADAGVQRAQDALDAGQAAAAAALQVPTTAAPKAVGSAAKSTWSGKVTDLKKLVIGVAAPFLLEEFNRGGVEGLLQALRQAGTAPITMLEANQTNLNKVATALKNELNYPGVEPVETKGLAISARK